MNEINHQIGEIQWQQYLHSYKSGLLEIIPAKLYSTEFYYSNKTVELRFFQRSGAHMSHSNMCIPGCLPNPQSFLIEHIRIDGISSAIKYGACRLDIGSKHYGYSPAWTYSLKEKGFKLNPKIFIAPLVYFGFQVSWEKPEEIGPGFNGKQIEVKPIQVVFYGQLAR